MKSLFCALSITMGGLLAASAMASEECQAPAACSSVETCGGPNRCGRCGRHCGCEKQCKIVCEMKEVKKTVWVVKCEEFCTTLPKCPLACDGKCGGCEACKAAEACCAEPTCRDGRCGKCDPCAAEKNKCFIPPKCGKVRDKKTLEKKEVVCKVPTYKCIVVYACSNCGSTPCGGESNPDPVPAPAAPAPEPTKTTENGSARAIIGASFIQ